MRERGKRSQAPSAGHMLPLTSPLYLRPRARVAELVDAADSDHLIEPPERNPQGEARQSR